MFGILVKDKNLHYFRIKILKKYVTAHFFFFSCELTDVGVRDYKRGNPENKDGQNTLILVYVTPEKETKSPLFFFPRIKCLLFMINF